MAFIGEYQHHLDEKGRMAIPAKFRPRLGKGAVVTRGLDRCLFLFPKTEWQDLAKKLITLPLTSANSRAFVRLMLAGASAVDIDSQGRILIPEYLRCYANLTKQAIVTGLYSRVEIWDEMAWKRYKARTEANSEQIAERLGELGI